MALTSSDQTDVVTKDETQHNQMEVLIVEDEQTLSKLFAQYLNEYSTDVAHTGAEAIKKAGPDTDIVLLDRRLPKMTGAEILDEMLQIDGFEARVAMLTGVAPGDEIRQLPIDDYRTKPISREEILSVVKLLKLRDDFEQTSDEFFRLNSKRCALKRSGKDETQVYTEITQEVDEVGDELEKLLGEVKNQAIFGDYGF